jgi:hypothetical protein
LLRFTQQNGHMVTTFLPCAASWSTRLPEMRCALAGDERFQQPAAECCAARQRAVVFACHCGTPLACFLVFDDSPGREARWVR